MEDRVNGWLALLLSQLQPVGVVVCLADTMLTWTDEEPRPLTSPNTLWTVGLVVCVLLGVALVYASQSARPGPRRPWEYLPGLDREFAAHYAARVGVDPRPWLVLGWICWSLVALWLATLVVVSLAALVGPIQP